MLRKKYIHTGIVYSVCFYIWKTLKEEPFHTYIICSVHPDSPHRFYIKRQRYLYPWWVDRQTDRLQTWTCSVDFFFFLPHLRVLLFKIASGYRTAPQIPKAHCLAPNSHSPSVSHEQLMRSLQCLYFGEYIHPG